MVEFCVKLLLERKDLSSLMIQSGHAKGYMGGRRTIFFVVNLVITCSVRQFWIDLHNLS